MNRRQAMTLLGALIGGACLAGPGVVLAREADPRTRLARTLARQSGLGIDHVRRILRHAHYLPSVIDQISRPYEAQPYARYRTLFVHDRLRRQGAAYLQAHAALFAENEQRYGVEREIVAAVLGMETRFGRNLGHTPLLDALYTLSVGYPRRAAFFQRELAELLRLCAEEGLDATRLTGSYAGAFGATQFMPSSYRAYAVDADGDGKRDVWHSAADIIASVAHYFHRHGWQHGRPVACWLPWRTSLTLRAKQGLRAFTSLRSLRSALPDLPDRWRDTDQVAVIAVVMREGEQRMALVHRNFYVITRWNRSYHYALACSELAARLGCVDCRVAEV